jgi:ubiquinone/menaquinone biosynthesis C-methylase UbiE
MPRQDTLWEKFLKPVFRLWLDEKALRELSESRDWEQESQRFQDSALIYPAYYTQENFHGIEGGYLTREAAITYDPITQYVLPPGENWVRQEILKAIQVSPRQILDLGCGTGSTTLLLKECYPNAQVTGIDLSPYMLAMANYKAEQKGLEINWLHRRAEATRLPDNSFDLVTVSLLFHETPPYITQAIIKEAFRLLVAGGQLIILDGSQNTLRDTLWLTEIFEEPYIKAYAQENLATELELAGFSAVKTDIFWFIHQISQGVKPLKAKENNQVDLFADSLLRPAV